MALPATLAVVHRAQPVRDLFRFLEDEPVVVERAQRHDVVLVEAFERRPLFGEAVGEIVEAGRRFGRRGLRTDARQLFGVHRRASLAKALRVGPRRPLAERVIDLETDQQDRRHRSGEERRSERHPHDSLRCSSRWIGARSGAASNHRATQCICHNVKDLAGRHAADTGADRRRGTTPALASARKSLMLHELVASVRTDRSRQFGIAGRRLRALTAARPLKPARARQDEPQRDDRDERRRGVH